MTSGLKSKEREFHLGFIIKVSKKWACRGFGSLAPVGPHWPPFAIPKNANSIIKQVVSAILKHNVSFTSDFGSKK